MEWTTMERPGYFGKKRDEKIALFNEKYGLDNWRIVWQWNGQIITPEFAYQLYEDGYYNDSFKREGLWVKLLKAAKEVYDLEPRDVESGLDYLAQKGIATHLQDVSIRRVIFRRGWKFEGNELVRIRHHDNYWGQNLSPGKVPFHLPELIIPPHVCPDWCDKYSIECFWQDNKVLQVKKS